MTRMGAGHEEVPESVWFVIVAVLTAVALLTGCGGSESPSPAVPTSAAPEEQRTYDEEERAVYREAVRRVDEFEARNQPILAAGQATRQAREFYRDTLLRWRSSYEQLQSYEREGIRVARRPGVISTRATSIKSFQDDAAEVVLRRCTDQSDLGMSRAGVPLPAVHAEPVIQEVVVYRAENRTWLIGPFTTTDKPCAGGRRATEPGSARRSRSASYLPDAGMYYAP